LQIGRTDHKNLNFKVSQLALKMFSENHVFLDSFCTGQI